MKGNTSKSRREGKLAHLSPRSQTEVSKKKEYIINFCDEKVYALDVDNGNVYTIESRNGKAYFKESKVYKNYTKWYVKANHSPNQKMILQGELQVAMNGAMKEGVFENIFKRDEELKRFQNSKPYEQMTKNAQTRRANEILRGYYSELSDEPFDPTTTKANNSIENIIIKSEDKIPKTCKFRKNECLPGSSLSTDYCYLKYQFGLPVITCDGNKLKPIFNLEDGISKGSVTIKEIPCEGIGYQTLKNYFPSFNIQIASLMELGETIDEVILKAGEFPKGSEERRALTNFGVELQVEYRRRDRHFYGKQEEYATIIKPSKKRTLKQRIRRTKIIKEKVLSR